MTYMRNAHGERNSDPGVTNGTGGIALPADAAPVVDQHEKSGPESRPARRNAGERNLGRLMPASVPFPNEESMP